MICKQNFAILAFVEHMLVFQFMLFDGNQTQARRFFFNNHQFCEQILEKSTLKYFLDSSVLQLGA